MNLIEINAIDIPDAWFSCIYSILDNGRKYEIQHGSYVGQTRLEFDWITIYIKKPYAEPYDLMLPQIPLHLNIPNPVENGYIEQYLPYLMTSSIESGEQYTYGSRINDNGQVDYWIDQLKKTPNTNQAVLQIAHPNDYMLSDPPCVVGDTLITTKNGFKKAIDVKIDDYVLTHKGRFRKVKKVFIKDYYGHMVIIENKNKSRLYLTTKHPVLIYNTDKCYDNKMICKPMCKKQISCYEKNGSTCKKSYKEYKECWVDSQDLTINNHLLFPKLSKLNDKQINDKYSIDEMWLFGLWIADGDVCKKDGIRYNLGSHETKIIKKVINLFKKIYNIDVKITYENKNKSCTRLVFWSRKITDKFLILFNKGAGNKNIPFDFLLMDNDKIESFIKGCVDGDGHIRKLNNRKINFYTSSKNVKNMFVYLLRKINIIPSITFIDHNTIKNSILEDGRVIKSNLDGYSISWTIDKEKNIGGWIDNKYLISKINDIYNTTNIYNTTVYNFEVDEDESYIANDIVVHNCLRSIDMRVKDNILIFYPYFRSWDGWGGLPSNLAGIAVLQKYMADEIGIEAGPIIASSKGLHIYGYVEELAKVRTNKG